MSSLRKVAATATNVACRTAGRRHVVRAARFVYRQACLDLPNDPLTNREHELQRWILGSWLPGLPIRVIDVGANVGECSRCRHGADGFQVEICLRSGGG